tara:strand:+ start:681 stop:1145 length:465 start_codon:yes stop_codon:yes gene_type:complete
MFLRGKNHIKFFFLLSFIALVNCQLNESSKPHGILFLENRSNKLTINKTNKNDVLNIIGQPHSKSIDNENEWIYIERVYVKGKYHKLGRNLLKSNNVLFLSFDKFGILKKKQLFDKEDIKKVAFSIKETKNDLSKTSFVEKLFSSLRAKMYGRK